jgi:rubredoxin
VPIEPHSERGQPCAACLGQRWATSETRKGGERVSKYVCTVCDWVYDPEIGDPDGGIEPGTAFEDIPEDWVCPECGVGKDMFEKVEE